MQKCEGLPEPGYRTCFVQYNKGNLLTNISPESTNSTNRPSEFQCLFQREESLGGDAQQRCPCSMLSVRTT